MTTPSESVLQEGQPDQAEAKNAKQLQDALVAWMGNSDSVRLSLANEEVGAEAITLAPELTIALLDVLDLISSGKGPQMIPPDTNLTTKEAAYLLCVQHSTLLKMLDDGTLPYIKVGPCRRIPAQKLFAYRKRKKARQKRALEEIARFDREHGLL